MIRDMAGSSQQEVAAADVASHLQRSHLQALRGKVHG
jgi:hypothetical protein